MNLALKMTNPKNVSSTLLLNSTAKKETKKEAPKKETKKEAPKKEPAKKAAPKKKKKDESEEEDELSDIPEVDPAPASSRGGRAQRNTKPVKYVQEDDDESGEEYDISDDGGKKGDESEGDDE